MADTNIAALPVAINGILIDDAINGQPAVLSTKIAEHFGKRHDHVLRDIDNLVAMLPESFNAPNFGEVDYKDAKGEMRRTYLLTRDAFSLLVMGFTGKAAVMWKLRYIEAFNALEKAALASTAELARESGYMQGRDEALCLPVMEAERKKGYLAGLKEADRLWRRNLSPRALQRMMELRSKGCTWPEIGKILGISPQAARKRVARACASGGVL